MKQRQLLYLIKTQSCSFLFLHACTLRKLQAAIVLLGICSDPISFETSSFKLQAAAPGTMP